MRPLMRHAYLRGQAFRPSLEAGGPVEVRQTADPRIGHDSRQVGATPRRFPQLFNAARMPRSTLIAIPRFDEIAVLSAISEHRATIKDGVPTAYYYLVAARLGARQSDWRLHLGRRDRAGRGCAAATARQAVIARSMSCSWGRS